MWNSGGRKWMGRRNRFGWKKLVEVSVAKKKVLLGHRSRRASDDFVCSGPHELSEAEKLLIESSDDYQSFISRSTRFVERALAHQIDLFSEYSSQLEEEK